MKKQSLKDIDLALARLLLDTVVKKQGRLTYKEIAENLSLRLGRKINPHYNLSVPLGNVSMLCFDLGLPLISANAIYSNATSVSAVGEGFYPFACELRPEYRTMTPVDAWRAELEKIRKCNEWYKLGEYLEKCVGKTQSSVKDSRSTDPFYQWLSSNTTLAESSIYKYSRAVNTVSEEMQTLGVISSPLREMTSMDLDVCIPRILSNSEFIEKNQRGNNMYSNALKQYRYFSHSETSELNESIEAEKHIDATTPSITERTALILSRIGQGAFRQSLMEKYQGKCIITGIDHPRLLIASHIKPWAASNNEERLSVDNGLLLSATYDRLFDNGLITFDQNGRVFLSALIGKENLNRLHLAPGMQFPILSNPKMNSNLEYHSEVIFIR